MNSNESIAYIPPSDKIDEYNLMAKVKIDSQFKFINELFQLKKDKLFQEHPNQNKKQIEILFKIFEHHYEKQINSTKKFLNLD